LEANIVALELESTIEQLVFLYQMESSGFGLEVMLSMINLGKNRGSGLKVTSYDGNVPRMREKQRKSRFLIEILYMI